MANPNLKNLNSVYAKISTLAITTTATAIVANNVSSSKVLKVSNVVVCNTTGNTATYTLDHYRNSTATKIAHEYAVSAYSTSVALSKDIFVYLEEGDSLRLTASADSVLEAVCTYEEIS